ncbi:MAG: YdbH family protein [Enterobacteriaceae bacterium]|jgi:hypothetical protein|nr:YdbH family protein [Enterobacteriaceae bacterium]
MVGKCVKAILIGVAIIMLSLMILWSTISTWLPKVMGWWLPEGTWVILPQRPELISRGFSLKNMQFLSTECYWADVGPMTLTYQNSQWHLHGESLDIDVDCLSDLSDPNEVKPSSAPLSLHNIQKQLPAFYITFDRLSITPWESYSGSIELSGNEQGQHLTFLGNLLSVSAALDNQQHLTINSTHLHLADTHEEFHISGEIQIPDDLATIPEQGNITGEFIAPAIDKPLLIELEWQQRDGHLFVTPQSEEETESENGKGNEKLLDFLWTLSGKTLTIQQGKWRWFYGSQPFSGALSMTLSDWNDDYSAANIEARLNMITQGDAGKGNAVLSIAEGKISRTDSALNMQLTGKVNQDQLSYYVSTPARLTGDMTNPTLRFLTGSLLRAVGEVTPDIYLHEARLPLAGITVTDKGVSGRLQTIINASHRYWGKYKLHLDGQARNFWLDQGHWDWNFWGNGDMPPLKAKWDMSGRGAWNDSLISLQRLSTGFDHLAYGMVHVDKPRLSLSAPLSWDRAADHYQADWQVHADKIAFDSGAYLPPSTLNIRFFGNNPANFQWKGDLSTDQIGPISLSGRWDGERIRGSAWWPEQDLQVFQTLLPADLGFKIRSGKLYAQAAFSISEQQGVMAGGHWVVKNGGMWLKDGELSGLDFIMSYRLKDHIWQLGADSPVKLRVKELNNLFDMRNITADLQGYYPHSQSNPLRLTNVGVDMLNGHVGMDLLSLPQKDPAVLTLKGIDLSELFTILKPKQFTMSGKVDGELPLFLNNSDWLVRNGWIENSDSLTLRLDDDLVRSISEDNIATGDIIDWLRYMEISRLRADVNLNNLGLLTMDSQIKGFNPTKNAERLVVLNYHHEEDLFQLWRSLRFGDNLQDSLQQLFSSPVKNKEKSQ